ncbi:neither inactivation nor afterpotential protein C-like [Uloborus diversus]|uniref:neither inactivation nor afterpotential protein C-like n=1 Tax=Uloborus diversus TaxID=327109 RepID=UPI00240A9540|nr:neither inactivation nor afterpotential protein C-like [Uloborus diversus]
MPPKRIQRAVNALAMHAGQSSTASSTSSAPFMVHIDPFEGDPSQLEFFCETVDDIINVNNWSGDRAIIFLKSKLKNAALQFFLESPSLRKTKDHTVILAALKDFFKHEARVTMADFHQLAMKPNESMKNLAHRISRVTSMVFSLPQGEALNKIKLQKLLELVPPDIRIKLLEAKIESFDEAVARANDLQELFIQASLLSQNAAQSAQIQKLSEQVNLLQEQLKSRQQSSSSSHVMSTNVITGSCALVKESEGKTYSSIGSPYWMAPEVIGSEQLRPYTKSCDIWSLGITAIELAEIQPPLFDIHAVRAMFQIARNPPPTLKKASDWSEDFKDFINECLERNFEHRPCAIELLWHPFITGMDDVTNPLLSPEEHLEQQLLPSIGNKAKQILQRLGNMVSENLYPLVPSQPQTLTVKNWNFKSDASSPYIKMLPDDLASVENVTEESVMEHLCHRFQQDQVYTYIGDVLIAINPRKKLPIYDSKIKTQYWEKARSDNAPHVFAVADRSYQQMLHHKRSQVIIIFGKCNSGKSFSAAQIINQLAFLSPSSSVGMAEKIQHLCPLLDLFGSARTAYNQCASRALKNISVTYTKKGKITGAIITAMLLDRDRITTTPQNEYSFHVLYCIYEGLKAEKRLAEFALDKLSVLKYLPERNSANPADFIAGYKSMYNAFRTFSFTEEEIAVILRIISAILLLGDVTYSMKETVVANNPYLISSAARNLSIDNELLCSLICKGACVEDAERERDAWVQFLYIRVFDWVVTSLNKQLSFSRLVLGDCYSISVIDTPGFGQNENNQLFRLCSNVIEDFLQNYIQQLMFFKELDEYKEEEVEIPFKYEGYMQQKKFLSDLVESERKLLSSLENSENITSLSSEYVQVENEKLTINHIFEPVLYNIQDLTAENVYMINESEFIQAFKTTHDSLTAAIANKLDEERKPLPGEVLITLPKLLEVMTEDFPHVVVCMLPTLSSREDIRFEPQCIVKQVRAFNLLETILIRQQGFARRLSFSEFLNRYKYLAFDFDEEVELSKQNCQLLLIRLKMDGYKMGKNKVFLKYYTEEYLSRLYETHVKKIVKIQAMVRRFIVKSKQKEIS